MVYETTIKANDVVRQKRKYSTLVEIHNELRRKCVYQLISTHGEVVITIYNDKPK